MSSQFDRQFSAVAAKQLDGVFGELAAISRGPTKTTGVAASLLSRGGEAIDEQGLTTTVLDAVWLVRKDLYTFGGIAAEPRSGDRLTRGNGEVWEVLRIDGGQAAVPWGADGSYWELRTKQVS